MAQEIESNPLILPRAPTLLSNAHVCLELNKTVPAEPERGLVPYYHYRVCLPDKTDAGHLNFRVGNTPHIMMFAGHIGFGINAEYRGKSLSYHACMLLAPFVRSVYSAVIITANPDNHASRRIIEKLGAKFLNETTIAPDDPHYDGGAKTKLRYEWTP